MSKIDSFAVDANLKSEPRTVQPDSFKGGMYQSFAVEAPMNMTPDPSFFKGGSKAIESFACKAPLGEKPQKGYDTYNTPMSKRALKQGKV
jgi:hypothetical protein